MGISLLFQVQKHMAQIPPVALSSPTTIKHTTGLQFFQQYPMQIRTLETYLPEPSQCPTMADTEWPKFFLCYYIQDIKNRRQVNYIPCMYKWDYNAQNKFWNFKCCTMYDNIAWKLVISDPQPPIYWGALWVQVVLTVFGERSFWW